MPRLAMQPGWKTAMKAACMRAMDALPPRHFAVHASIGRQRLAEGVQGAVGPGLWTVFVVALAACVDDEARACVLGRPWTDADARFLHRAMGLMQDLAWGGKTGTPMLVGLRIAILAACSES